MATQILLVPRKLQQRTPSICDGLSREMEISQRIYGCQLIQKAGVLLKLEAVTVASAQTILHRFYYRKSLKKFDVRLVVTASLLLACKLEEDPRRVRNLIDVVHLLSKAEDAGVPLSEENINEFLMDHDSTEFEVAKAETFRCERYILKELGFMVSQTLVHPHRYILQYIHALCKGDYLPTNRLSQIAWGYLNDSMRTTLCCEVQPAVVAVGSIFLAACDLNIPLAKETGWYELFDVTWDDVVKVCTRILSLYKREPPKYLKLAEKVAVLPKVEKERMHARIERDNDKMEEDTTEADEDAKPASAAASAPSAAGSAAAAAAASDAAAPVRAEGESVKENVAAAEGQSQSEVLNDGKAEQPQQLHHRHRHHPQTRQTAREPPHAPKRAEVPPPSAGGERSAESGRREERGKDRSLSSVSPRRVLISSSRPQQRSTQESSRDIKDLRHQSYRDGMMHRSKQRAENYRNGHRESREESCDPSSPRRGESRERYSSSSSSREAKWERFSFRDRYDGHSSTSTGFRERRRYLDDGNSFFSPRRGEHHNDDNLRRGGGGLLLPSAKRPARHESPGRMHRVVMKSSSSSSSSRRN